MAETLAGARILVTRQAEKSAQFMSHLNALDARPTAVPLLKIVGQDFVLPDLASFRWLVFTSANGVKYFFEKIPALPWPSHLKIMAVGKKTNESLMHYGHQADFMPSKFSAKVLAKEFFQANRKPGKCLLVRGNLARKEFENALIERNQAYDTLEVYQTLANQTVGEQLNQVLSQVTFDYITFTSPSTVRYFYDMVTQPISEKTKLVCIGPTTAQTAEKYYAKSILVPSHYTVEGMIETMIIDREEVKQDD